MVFTMLASERLKNGARCCCTEFCFDEISGFAGLVGPEGVAEGGQRIALTLTEVFGKCLHKMHLKIGSILEVLLEFRELCCLCFFQLLDIGGIGIPEFLDVLG